MKKVIIIVLLLFAANCAAKVFDNQRKGVVFGAGIAFTPYSTVSPYYLKDRTGMGLGGHVLLGYGFSSRDFIVAEVNGSYCQSSEGLGPEKHHASQGFYGISWYHYYGRVEKSLFTVFGVGYYAFKVQYLERDKKGNALLLGIGYEFGRHVQCGVYYAAGETGERSPYVSHRQLNLMVSSIAF
jgi:hypothetical protein